MRDKVYLNELDYFETKGANRKEKLDKISKEIKKATRKSKSKREIAIRLFNSEELTNDEVIAGLLFLGAK